MREYLLLMGVLAAIVLIFALPFAIKLAESLNQSAAMIGELHAP